MPRVCTKKYTKIYEFFELSENCTSIYSIKSKLQPQLIVHRCGIITHLSFPDNEAIGEVKNEKSQYLCGFEKTEVLKKLKP